MVEGARVKTPRFWYPKSSGVLPVLLSPLSGVFRAGTFLRRAFAKPYRASVPVICVGNAVAGGAGKTPVALALARMLFEEGFKPVFVTRGYGGSGDVTYVDPARHTYEDVGDEALLLAQTAPTWAGRDRVAAIRQAETNGSVIIMDDGLQNPHVKPALSLLVVDGEAGIGNGHIIPAGPLRESFAAALDRAAALIILGDRDQQNLAARTELPVFRARLQPDLPRGFARDGKFVAFAGIGRPEKFYATARTLGLDIIAICDFPDHHPYSEADIETLRLQAEEQGAHLLTTTKDAARLPPDFRAEVMVLPVALAFDDPAAPLALMRLVRNAC